MKSFSNRQFYFFHIPRTAGTTFSHSVLSQYFKPAEICEAFDYHGLLKLPQKDLGNYRLFRGHFFYFLYRLLPQKPVYLCFLRNPLERVISGYQLMLNDPTHYFHQEVCGLGSFEAYLNSKYLPLDFMVSSLAIDLDPKPVALHCRHTRGDDFYIDQAILEDVCQFRPSRTELEIAKTRLAEFEFVGIQEYFRDSVDLLTRTFGWESLGEIETRNASTTRHVELKSLPQRTLDLLISYHELDLELYDFALRLFRDRLSRTQITADGAIATKVILPMHDRTGPSSSTRALSADHKFRMREGRDFSEKPLYFVQLPFAVSSEVSLEIGRSYFLPSEVCQAWTYPELLLVPNQLFLHYQFYRGNFFWQLARVVHREVEYMIFLAEPIKCLYRIYRHIIGAPEHPFYTQVAELRGFEEYAEQHGNFMVKNLSGDLDPKEFTPMLAKTEKSAITESIWRRVFRKAPDCRTLDLAKSRIQQAAFLGIAERFEESIALMTRTFGWAPMPEALQLNPSPAIDAQLTADTRERVRPYVSWDLELYEFSIKFFEGRKERFAARAKDVSR